MRSLWILSIRRFVKDFCFPDRTVVFYTWDNYNLLCISVKEEKNVDTNCSSYDHQFNLLFFWSSVWWKESSGPSILAGKKKRKLGSGHRFLTVITYSGITRTLYTFGHGSITPCMYMDFDAGCMYYRIMTSGLQLINLNMNYMYILSMNNLCISDDLVYTWLDDLHTRDGFTSVISLDTYKHGAHSGSSRGPLSEAWVGGLQQYTRR